MPVRKSGRSATRPETGERVHTTAPLVGRAQELRLLEELLDRTTDRGSCIVVRGDAGIGKTVLLEAAVASAHTRGFRVLQTVGIESEGNLAFAGLHRLLRGLLPGASALPPRQRDALLSAFGMADAAEPDLFLIGLGALSLLSDASRHAPVLLVIDDAQWLDGPTREVVSFLARRLENDPILVLAAERDGFRARRGEPPFDELRITRLSDAESAELLDGRTPALDAKIRERILSDAAGNPLALVELPVAIGSGDDDEAGATGPSLPLTARLKNAFASRLVQLPEATRAVLLVAAIDDDDDLGEILGAARIVAGASVSLAELDMAGAAGLATVDDMTVRFRHPLVRSAILSQAGVAARRSAHAALATVVTGEPDRRAWHRANAAVGQDEDVALEVAASAERARHRGGIDAAIAAQERATRLTPDPQQRAVRLLVAAEMAFERGSHDLVERYLAKAQRLGLGEMETKRALWIREMFDDGTPGDAERVRSLVSSAQESCRGGDTNLAMMLLLGAALRSWWADPGAEARRLVVDAAWAIPIDETDPRVIATVAIADPIASARRLESILVRITPYDLPTPNSLRLIGMAAHAIGEFERSGVFLTAAVDGLRAQGRLALLAQTLSVSAHGSVEMGNWQTAITSGEECVRLAEETAQPIYLTGGRTALGCVAALQGDRDRAYALAADAERVVLPRRLSDLLAIVQVVRGMADLTAGLYTDAYAHLRLIFDPAEVAHHPRELYRAIDYFAEAAALSGNHDDARALLRPVEAAAMVSPSPKLHVGVAFARAVLAADEDAEALFAAAFAAMSDGWTFFRARLQLAHGAWLRRHRRARESRASLRAACETFDAQGLTTWGDSARQELLASGETRAARGPSSWTQLSPQELQIARMAAEGLSNAQIGERLYLSHRTVGSHLYRLYPKLGVASRMQLRAALGVEATGS